MNNNAVGLDISKNVFHLYSQTEDGKVVKKKLKRGELPAYIANRPVSLIGMEACGGAHDRAREFSKPGHKVVLLNTRFVKGFVIGNKNDFKDAEAIFTSVTRPNKRVVAVKNETQQAIQMLYRLRQQRIDRRSVRVNQVRGLLSGRGITLPQGLNPVTKQ